MKEMTYVIFGNKTKTEFGFCLQSDWKTDKKWLRVDDAGNPMKIIMKFDCETYDEAHEKFKEVLQKM